MKRALTVLLLALFWALGPAAAQGVGEERAVRQTFDDYRNALQDRQGDIAGFLVTPETLAFYAAAAKAAVHATPEELADLPLVQQLLALRLRQAVPGGKLKDMTPEEIVGLSVYQGLVDAQGLRGLRLGDIRIDGDVALAPQVDPWGRDIGVTWRFRKTQGTWRVDLRPTLMAANALLVAMKRERGTSDRRFLLDLVRASSGLRTDESLFVPPAAAWEEDSEGTPPSVRDGTAKQYGE